MVVRCVLGVTVRIMRRGCAGRVTVVRNGQSSLPVLVVVVDLDARDHDPPDDEDCDSDGPRVTVVLSGAFREQSCHVFSHATDVRDVQSATNVYGLAALPEPITGPYVRLRCAVLCHSASSLSGQ